MPNGAESGWGASIAHQGDSIFAVWYTYNVLGGTPLWLSALAARQGTGNVYTGPIYQNSGPRFDAYDATKVVANQVGTATFTFADGDNATFEYKVMGHPYRGRSHNPNNSPDFRLRPPEPSANEQETAAWERAPLTANPRRRLAYTTCGTANSRSRSVTR